MIFCYSFISICLLVWAFHENFNITLVICQQSATLPAFQDNSAVITNITTSDQLLKDFYADFNISLTLFQ